MNTNDKPLRRYYLLRWNPTISSFALDTYRRATTECPEGFLMDWSVYEYQEARKDDIYFMLRTGDDKEGLVFRGLFLSDPYPGKDWAGTQRQRHYVDISAYDCAAPDDEAHIPIPVLQARLPDIDWKRGHSGQLLTPEQGAVLEALWDKYATPKLWIDWTDDEDFPNDCQPAPN